MKRFTISLKMVLRSQLRNRTAMFFSLIFPTLIYVLYGYIFKNDHGNATGTGSGNIGYALWMMPSIITMGVAVTGIFGSVPMVTLRERGVFRRIQATPMPAVQYLLALVVAQIIMVVFQVVLILLVGALVFHVTLQADGWYLDIAFILIGSMAFIALGQLIAAISPRVETANILNQILNMATIFLCNIFLPFSIMPDALQKIGRVLLGFLMVDGLRPAMVLGNVSTGNTLNNPWLDLAGLGLYLLVALAISARFFRWS